MLVGTPKSIVIDFKHFRKIKTLARKNHLKLYELMHIIIDGHFSRMERLGELRELGIGKEMDQECHCER
jgi:hypothetical protein